MSLTVNFSATESLAFPSQITLEDTSTGTDLTLTSRIVYIQLTNGNYLVEEGNENDYSEWAIGDSTVVLDLLPRSEAVNVTVKWLAGTTIAYTKTILYGFDLFDYLFAYELLQTQTGKPTIINDENYYGSFIQFIVNLFNAQNSITTGDDIYSAQQSFDRNYYLIQNQIKFF